MAAPTVRREQLAQALAEKFSNLSKREAVDIINYLVELIANSLQAGKQVKLPGLGTFRVREKKARVAINPKTGEKVHVPAKKVPKFYASKDLKELVK